MNGIGILERPAWTGRPWEKSCTQDKNGWSLNWFLQHKATGNIAAPPWKEYQSQSITGLPPAAFHRYPFVHLSPVVQKAIDVNPRLNKKKGLKFAPTKNIIYSRQKIKVQLKTQGPKPCENLPVFVGKQLLKVSASPGLIQSGFQQLGLSWRKTTQSARSLTLTLQTGALQSNYNITVP